MTEKELIELLRRNYVALDESVPPDIETFQELLKEAQANFESGLMGDTLVLFVVQALAEHWRDNKDLPRRLRAMESDMETAHDEIYRVWSLLLEHSCKHPVEEEDGEED